MKCFYHDDMDGRSAAAIVANYENNYNQNDFHEINYSGNILNPDVVNVNEKVYIVDYSFKPDTVYLLDALLAKTKDIIWCDHHTSSIRLLDTLQSNTQYSNIKGLIRDGESGASLIYQFLHNVSHRELPMAVKYVSDYDCWKYIYGDSTAHFSIGVSLVENNYNAKIWKDMFFGNEIAERCALNQILTDGATVKTYVDNNNKFYCGSYAFDTVLDGHSCIACNIRSNSWIFGDKLKNYDIGISFVYNGSKYQYSLFSLKPDVDCSKVAEKFGGGGHKGAAGFTSDHLVFE